MHLENVIDQKLLQISNPEEGKLQFSTLFLPVTFLLVTFSRFSQRFLNQHKILDNLYLHFANEMFLGILALFETLKSNSQAMAKNIEKLI